MNILISTILSNKQKVGITEYLIGLIRGLQEIDKKNKYYILTTRENRKFFHIVNSNFLEIPLNIFDFSKAGLRLQYLFFSKLFLPLIIKKYNIDIFHEPSSWFVNKKTPTITTIHDIIELSNYKYTYLFNSIKRRMIYSALKNSRYIITVSKHSQKKIEKLTSKKVFVIYNGINPVKTELSRTIIANHKLTPKKYFIFIGTLLKHKNLLKLLKAFVIFNNSHWEYKLVLLGKKGNATGQIEKYIREREIEHKITLTDYVSEKIKKSLINDAKALLLVSKEEGFGFPILEAQQLGTPVITSNCSSTKEIANDSALLIDPESIESIASAMVDIADNSYISEKLRTKGFLNVKRFNWIETAKKTLAIYNLSSE